MESGKDREPSYFCYMRISTKEERGKQGYSRQEKSLERYAREHKIEYLLTFKEDESGKSFDGRKQWQKLEKLLQKDDTIVFKDVSRFSREAENGYKKYMSLMERGVNLIFYDNPTLCTDYIKKLLNIAEKQDLIARESTRFIAKILLISELDRCEQERKAISKRTKDGMKAREDAAKEKGESWKAGRKEGQLDKMTDELRKDLEMYSRDRSIKAITIMNKHHICRNTFKKYLKVLAMQA